MKKTLAGLFLLLSCLSLSAQNFDRIPFGKAVMRPYQGQVIGSTTPWDARDVFGNPISCVGTNSACLQEFINFTAANGWPAEVDCRGTNVSLLSETIFIPSTVGITVPVVQDWSFHSYGCNLSVNVVSSPAITFDSQGASVFDWDGKIVYTPSAPVGGNNPGSASPPSCVVYFHPTSNTQDGFPGIYAGYIRIKSPVANSAGAMPGVVCGNVATGSIIQQRLDFHEVNANNVAYYGLIFYGAGATTGLLQSEINVNQIHGMTLHGVDVSYNGINQANYNGNQWKINNIQGALTTSRGIDTYETGGIYDIGVINASQGGLGIGIVAETGANYNKFRYGAIASFTTNDWLDNGTCNWFSGGAGVIGGNHGTQLVLIGGTSGCAKITETLTGSSVVLPSAGLLIGLTAAVSQAGATPVVQFTASGAAAAFGIIRQNGGGGGGAIIALSSTQGTIGVPSPSQTGNGLGQLIFGGDTGTDLTKQSAAIQVVAAANFTTSSTPANMIFSVTAASATAVTQALEINASGGIWIGTTNVDKGANNLGVQGTVTVAGIASTAQADVVCTTAAGLLTYQVSATGCAASSERFKNMRAPLTREEIEHVSMGLVQAKRWTYKDHDFGDPSEYVGFTAEQIAAIDDRFITRDASGLPYAVKHQQLAEVAIAGFAMMLQDMRKENEASRLRTRHGRHTGIRPAATAGQHAAGAGAKRQAHAGNQ